MNKKIIFTVIIFFLSLQEIFSEQVTIKFSLSNNEIYAHDFDSEITYLTISPNLFGFSDKLEDYYITKIEGFEQFQNLKFLEIKNFMNIADFSFLENLCYLTELYINSVLVEDLSFLEKLQNLEILDAFIYTTEKNSNNLKNTEIDLKDLLFLKRIDFRVMIIGNNEDDFIPLNNIPNFINVQNQPKLNIGNNGISTLSDEKINQLEQYSEVFLYPNPIIENQNELQKLQRINIQTR